MSVLIAIITFLCYHLICGLDLSDYETASYTNPVQSGEFLHFATHNGTGTVYIGAIDALYQLTENFKEQERVSTAISTCEGDVTECPNYNKILLIDYAYNRLITCGSENIGLYGRGACKTRELINIGRVLQKSSNQPVVPSGMLTTEAIIAPDGPDGDAFALFVAATYDKDRTDWVFPLSNRTLGTNVDTLFSQDAKLQLVTAKEMFDTFLIRNVHAYTWKGFTYFVTHQRLEEMNNFTSKINRVCHDSDNFDSFTEITLQCQGRSGIVYNLIQAAYVGSADPSLAQSLNISHISDGDVVFYGVFAKSDGMDGYLPSNQSALCVFRMQDIEAAFFEAVAGCFGRNNTLSAEHNVNYLAGAVCPGFNITDEQVEGQLCTAFNWMYAKGVVPVESVAVIEWSDIVPSSIITTTHRQHTFAFVGTTEGDIVKVHIEDMDNGREYERFSVGSHVLKDTDMDKDQEELTILTKQKLLKLQVSNCSAYTTCDECIGINGGKGGDPYCGWCTLERRCTRFDSCLMADEDSRWLSYNNTQCVAIRNVAPCDSIPITETEQQIILTLEQLPEASSDTSYQCVFDDISPVPANIVDSNKLACTTPAASDIPDIQPGNDHVTMQLYVYSTETEVKFVQRDFYFYECNLHTKCVSCTNSSWACDWCIYSNKCTHDNSKCYSDDSSSIINGINNPEMANRQGYEECPQLNVQDGERLVPVGESTSIRVSGINLPEESMVMNYKCALNIEGIEIETEATRSGDDFICQPRMYTYSQKVQDLDVSLTVIWNNNRRLDDVFGFTVTLYKCENERPDCSRCLSNITTRPELMCGWCKANGMCTVTGSSACSGGWIPSDTSENCPAPVLLGVWPPSGPHEGNTTIAVMGTDLGQHFSDIHEVTVGGKICSTDGFSKRYMPGRSVSCRTKSGATNSVASIAVTVIGSDGTEQQSTGNVIFTYRDPSISSLKPVEGPAAGGTIVTITGHHLDACSEISAMIGSDCTMNRVTDVLNETTAICRTTNSPVSSSHLLVMSFDGAKRESQEMFTYRPNPTVADVHPLKTIESGGISITVTGTGFELAQEPQMVLYIGDEKFEEMCQVHNDTIMLCKSPLVNAVSDISRRKREATPLGQAQFGFIIGDVTDLLTWSKDNNATLEYYEDPEYEQFEDNPLSKSGGILLIKGTNLDLGSTENDVKVYIGTEEAVTTSLTETVLTVELPEKNPGRECIDGNRIDNPCVVVHHGNLVFYIGTLKYQVTSIQSGATIGIAAACVSLIVLLVIVLTLIRHKVQGQKEDLDKLAVEMNEMESKIADDIREAFVKLQTDVTDLTSDLKGTGMPFVAHREYVKSMFFAGLDIQPMACDPEGTTESTEKAMIELSKLLSNKEFLMAFIQILDQDKSIPNKDKLVIGSLLTVLMILENKLGYLTDVLFTLMTSQIQDAIDEDKPNKLFQRTESITEKLLSNWIALSLYDFLKDHAAHPLYLLYHAIKCQSEKGPIDAVSGKSHISLNDENIISERMNFETLTLHVVLNNEDGDVKDVKVLDVDTIGQVKGKILDAIHRSRAYSSRTQPWQVDLEWRHGRSGHLILQDIDVSCYIQPGWKRINTLKHFSVNDGSNVALTLKQDVPNATLPGGAVTRLSNVGLNTEHDGLSKRTEEYQSEEGVQIWHLVKPEDEDPYMALKKKKKSYKRTIRLKKHVHEITFSRILGTKGTVQEYMDDMFAAILNTDNVPIGIKYIFDFFDELAVRYSIKDESVLHKWKSNTLPLRFWQKIISNPQYIFDICQSQCVEASLSVISQAFYDAFRRNPTEISKDASYRKLLYNREIPQYRKMVENYYSSVSQMQQISNTLLADDLNETCQKFTGIFSWLSTLLELHKLIVQYKSKLMDTLEEDEHYQEPNLAEKLGQVVSMFQVDSDNGIGDPRYIYS